MVGVALGVGAGVVADEDGEGVGVVEDGDGTGTGVAITVDAAGYTPVTVIVTDGGFSYLPRGKTGTVPLTCPLSPDPTTRPGVATAISVGH